MSIALVLFGHATGTLDFPVHHQRFGVAEAGVRVFFVISGFIITRLLLKELEDTGRIHLPGFYRRRILRIFPAFYSYWLVTVVLVLLGILTIPHRQLLYAASYVINYTADRAWNVGHLWSLAVEEQFYLLWPLTLCLLGRKRAFWAAGLAVLLVPPIRVAQFFLLPAHRLGIAEEFHTIADCIAMGCLVAGCQDWLWQNSRYRRFLTSHRFWAVPAAMALSIVVGVHPLVNWLFSIPLFNLCTALCIDRWTRMPSSDPIAVLLNWRPIAFVGVLSYSLYLWQQPFLDRYSHHLWNSFPINITLAFALALGSYHLIEKPFLKLRHRIRQASTVLEGSPGARLATNYE